MWRVEPFRPIKIRENESLPSLTPRSTTGRVCWLGGWKKSMYTVPSSSLPRSVCRTVHAPRIHGDFRFSFITKGISVGILLAAIESRNRPASPPSLSVPGSELCVVLLCVVRGVKDGIPTSSTGSPSSRPPPRFPKPNPRTVRPNVPRPCFRKRRKGKATKVSQGYVHIKTRVTREDTAKSEPEKERIKKLPSAPFSPK